jgi:hypothetical protein
LPYLRTRLGAQSVGEPAQAKFAGAVRGGKRHRDSGAALGEGHRGRPPDAARRAGGDDARSTQIPQIGLFPSALGIKRAGSGMLAMPPDFMEWSISPGRLSLARKDVRFW